METHSLTLAKLVEEYNATTFIYADRGNGAGFGESGKGLYYGYDAEKAFGKLLMHRLDKPIISDDGIKCHYASDWQGVEKKTRYNSHSDYQFRILF